MFDNILSSKLGALIIVSSLHFLLIFMSIFSVKPKGNSNSVDSVTLQITYLTITEPLKQKPNKLLPSPITKKPPKKIKSENPKFVKLNKKKVKKDERKNTVKEKSEIPTKTKHQKDNFIQENSAVTSNVKIDSASNPRVIRTRARIGSNIDLCKPQYPRSSRRRGEQGTVVLRFLINEDGKAEKAEIKSSSGFEKLDTAAKKGLFSCKFLPATENGNFVKDWAVIPYVFQLK